MTTPRIRLARELDWNLLKVFCEIAEAKGVTSAANALWRKQSTISLALKRLERDLGRRLCARGPGGFELTDEGKVLIDTCNRIYQSINELPNRLDNISEDVHGQLRITTISNFNSKKFNQLVCAINRRCPFVEINIDVAPWESIPPTILRNKSDFGITPISVKYPELEYSYLCDEHHHLYCGNGHHLFGKTISNPDLLAQESLILTGNDEPEQLTKFRIRHGIGAKVAGITSHLEEAKRLVTLGIGICFLPEEFAEDEVNKQRLWPLTPRIKELSLKIFLVAHPNSSNSIIAKLFFEELNRINNPETVISMAS